MKIKLLAGLVVILIGTRAWAIDQFQPGQVWNDVNDKPIQAHGGGILVRDGTYYWYGEDRTQGNESGVSCYSSTDLYNWKFESVIFAQSNLPEDIRNKTFIERPKVIFNSRSGKYVLWMHLEQDGYRYSRAGIAVSDKPAGPFVFLKSIRPVKSDIVYKEDSQYQQKELGGTYRDMNLMADDDGRAYVFYASEDNATMYVVRLNDEFTGPETPAVEGKNWARILIGQKREAPAPFKFKGRYYLITSACTGWRPNVAQWAVAENILGPYQVKDNPCIGPQAEKTFRSQSTFVLPLPGEQGRFIFMADRWFSNKLYDSRYIWLPFTMMPDGTFKLEWQDEWDLSFFEKPPVKDSLSSARNYLDFDFDWRFSKGDFPLATTPDYNDSGWSRVNLPHDWSIEGPYSPDYASGTGYLPGGIGWYRKSFQIDPSLKDKMIAIEFDGIYNNSEVWLNGHYLGKRPYGYSSFQYDLTEYVKFAPEINVIAVKVDHSQFADSRWYTGSGIYRNVRMRITDKLHIAHWGTFVTTPVIEQSNAQVKIETTVDNNDKEAKIFQLQSDIIDQQGNIVAGQKQSTNVAAGKNIVITQQLSVNNPHLWDINSPYLYQLKNTIIADEKIIDGTITPFGIRQFHFDPNSGFFLNGKNIKIKGVCLHHDAGCVGAAVPVKMWKRRLELIKQIGANAIRTSHNPPSAEFLDLCDRMGLIVMDEAFDEFTPGKNKWVKGWNAGTASKFGYNEAFEEWAVRDISDMVKRDRNHPSIILWSIGNEVDYPNDPFSHPSLGNSYKPQNPPAENLTKYGRILVKAVKDLDTTRPVTAALASVQMSNAVGFAQLFDVVGYNYQEKNYEKDHKDYPNRCILDTENKSSLSAWEAVEKNDYVAGQFIWIGFSYLGEATSWPNKAWNDGLFDLCGFKNPQGWFRQSIWAKESVVFLACQETQAINKEKQSLDWKVLQPLWNWQNGKKINISCFTNCDEAELFLNGASLGKKSRDEAKERVLNWEIPFTAGSLKAVGKNNGRVVCEYILNTAGRPARIKLLTDTMQLAADGKDIAHIEFQIIDANNVVVPNAETIVKFNVDGPAEIRGIGNANTDSAESYGGTSHAAWLGRGLLILQSTKQPGTVTLKASAQALESDSITINIK
jgi:beta-galactosidase